VVTRDPAVLQFLQELAASGVRAPFIDEGDDLASLPVVAVPGPALSPLGADERPELIHFQVAHAPRVRGLVQSRAASRRVLRIVLALKNKMRSMSRMPAPLIVSGTTKSRTAPTHPKLA
jgi:hypothetical protein